MPVRFPFFQASAVFSVAQLERIRRGLIAEWLTTTEGQEVRAGEKAFRTSTFFARFPCRKAVVEAGAYCANDQPNRERNISIQNLNGVTETDSLSSDDRWTVKFTSLEAFVSPTVTEIAPLHVTVRLSLLVEVVTIFSPRRYSGFTLSKFDDFSACETVEFLAA